MNSTFTSSTETIHTRVGRTFIADEVFLVGYCAACKRKVETTFSRGPVRVACVICNNTVASSETRSAK